jgi:Flp pilus assembly protein TadB
VTVALLGALVGTGVMLLARALRPHRPSLEAAFAALDRRGLSVLDQPAGTSWQRATSSLGTRLSSGRPLPRRVAADLRVTGRNPEQLAVEQLLTAATGCGVPLAMAVLLVAAGVTPPTATLLLASGVFGLLGWFTPRLLLRDRARSRRAAFVHVLSGYLDLVTVVLAGGAGVETALQAAAEAGDGWAVGELRGALVRARSLRRSPWDEFAELGRDLAVPELVELAASVRLAGEQGARIRSSLAARAASLRGHQLARVEAEAQSATERMALPTVLLFLGFLVFIGYPAVAQLLGGGL